MHRSFFIRTQRHHGLFAVVIIACLLLAYTNVVGQSFGPGLRVQDLLSYYNPVARTDNLRLLEKKRQLDVDLGVGLSNDYTETAQRQQTLAGVRYRFQVPGSEDDEFAAHIKVEVNRIDPVQHFSAQLGGRYEIFLDLGDNNELFLSFGALLGIRQWSVRDAPLLRPWDAGDPLLAATFGSKLRPFLKAGGAVRYAIAVAPDYRSTTRGKKIILFLAASSPDLVHCRSADCYTFNSGLPNGNFSLGSALATRNNFRIDALVQYRDFHRYAIGLRQYYLHEEHFPLWGTTLGGYWHYRDKGGPRIDLEVGRDLNVNTWLLNLGWSGKIGGGDQSPLHLRIGFFWLRYPGATPLPSESFLPARLSFSRS